MLRDPGQSVTDQPIVRVGPARRQATEPLRQCQSDAIPTTVEVKDPLAPERPQLVLCVLEAFGKLEGFVQGTSVSGRLGPLVYINDAPSAVCSFISRRASGRAPSPRAAIARSTRLPHSSISDSCIHSGTAAAVSATPSDASPFGEKAQSSAARRLSIWHP